jgi:hypothetical protein
MTRGSTTIILESMEDAGKINFSNIDQQNSQTKLNNKITEKRSPLIRKI